MGPSRRYLFLSLEIISQDMGVLYACGLLSCLHGALKIWGRIQVTQRIMDGWIDRELKHRRRRELRDDAIKKMLEIGRLVGWMGGDPEIEEYETVIDCLKFIGPDLPCLRPS